MAELAQQKKAALKKASAGQKQKVHRKGRGKKPAYVQTKLAMSTPGDKQEQEADQVADRVSRSPRGVQRMGEEQAQRADAVPQTEQGDQSLAPLSRQEEEEAQTKLFRQEEEEAQTKLQRQPIEEEEQELQTKLHRQEEEEEMQAKLYRQTEEEEEQLQTRIARQEEEEAAQAKLQRQPIEEEEEELQAKLHRQEEEEEMQTKLFRQPLEEEEEELQPMLARQPLEEEEEELQPSLARQEEEETQEDQSSTQVPPEVEQKIEEQRGNGAALPESVQADMEEKIGADFSSVVIHDDSAADELCKSINARAFTIGRDVFFSSGEYAPGTEAGRELLAHELTHVVQQNGGVQRVYRAVDPRPSASNPAAESALSQMSTLELPPIKHRHAALYTGTGARRAAGYKRNTSQSQVSVWNQAINISDDAVVAKLREHVDEDFVKPTSTRGQVPYRVGNETRSESWSSLKRTLRIPDWDRRGNKLTSRGERFQVDHMVELQVFGDSTGNAGNVIGNLELLKGSPNTSSGSTIKNNIYRNVTNYLAAEDPGFNALAARTKATRRRSFLNSHSITFTNMTRGGGRAGQDSDWWTRAEIEDALPLAAAQAPPENRLEGSSGTFVLASGPGGIEISRYRYNEGNLTFAPRNERAAKAMAGVRIREFQLNSEVETGTEGSQMGTMKAEWDLPRGFRSGEEVDIPLLGVGRYCGAPGEIPALNTNFDHLSPVSLPQLEIRNGGIHAQGQITPSIPLLANNPISVELDGNDIRFEVEYSASQLALPFPGIAIDEATIALLYSTEDGFGGEGAVDFSVNRLGAGNLTISADQRNGFSAEGNFEFDTELFDRAEIEVWYRDNAFGGRGTIGIDNAEKIKGIRSANLSVELSEDSVTAEGDVQPDIPGVQQAGLTVSHSEEDGLVIGGELQLSSETPGIESGSISVTVRKQEDQWQVAARGTAQPSVPGIDSELSVEYDDGAFSAEAQARYQRGMLDGTIRAGATNRTLDESGNPTGDPGNDLIFFGGGELTLGIAPWLQATVGVEFLPNADIQVRGEIGLPDSIEIFPRKEISKDIFSIDIPIPIVPGIFAEVGGGLDATAGIGPGEIDELRLGIEYNPNDEANTHVYGSAHLNIPADAGLRLSVRGGIGLGIPAASVSGGLEVGGQLGIEGAAEAGVQIDWRPSTGLELNAYGRLSAQPKFTFDVSGYVEVEALFFTIYENRWELASFEYGSDMTFGVRFPVHYREGEPFDISLDDVEFEVPDVNPRQLLSDLVDRVA